MRVVDFETYATENDASLLGMGDAGLHKSTARMGRSTWKRHIKRQGTKDMNLIKRRQDLRKQYEQEIADGNIRPPTVLEKTAEIASGCDDNPSVQAARRLLLKRTKG